MHVYDTIATALARSVWAVQEGCIGARRREDRA